MIGVKIERRASVAENSIKARRRLLLILSAFYLLAFLIFYIPNYAVEDIEDWDGPSHTVYLAVRAIIEKLLEFFAPVAIGAHLFLTEPKAKGALIRCIKLSLPALIYSLPYCYLFALSLGYDSIDGALISLGLSAIGLIIGWASGALLYFAARGVSAYPVFKKLRSELPPMRKERGTKAERKRLWAEAEATVRDGVSPARIFDTDDSTNLGILGATLVGFAVKVIGELISTVSFFVGSGGEYSVAELMSVLLAYVFLLIELIAVYSAAAALKNKALSENK